MLQLAQILPTWLDATAAWALAIIALLTLGGLLGRLLKRLATVIDRLEIMADLNEQLDQRGITLGGLFARFDDDRARLSSNTAAIDSQQRRLETQDRAATRLTNRVDRIEGQLRHTNDRLDDLGTHVGWSG